VDSADESTQRAFEALVHLELAIERLRAVQGRQFGLPAQDLRLVNSIALMGGRAIPRELSAELHLSSGTLTTMLDRIETAGYIVRKPNPNDRRSVFVELTKAGRLAGEAVSDTMHRVLGEVTSQRARTALTRAINELSAALEDEISEPGAS
jgi:DNA-binding MarR family transcriptional regulator